MAEENTHGLCNVLAHLMKECDIDDASLSRQTDIPASTISRMRLIPEANPTAATLRPIAKFFDVSISQLLGDEPLSQNRIPGTSNPISFTSSMIPVIDWNLIPEWIENKKTPTNNAIKWIPSEQKVGEKTFGLIIPTETFGLFLRKGSTILVDPDQVPKDGDIVLLKIPREDSIFLRQILVDGNNYYVRSVNPELKSIEPLKNDAKFFGVVVETRFSLQESRVTSIMSTKNEFVFGRIHSRLSIAKLS